MMSMNIARAALGDTRELAPLAIPLILTQLSQVALTTVDIVMMGWLGADALAAGGLALVIFNQIRTMGVGLVTAVGNQVAAASTRSNPEETVRDLVRASTAITTIAGVCGALIMIIASSALVWLGQDPVVVSRTQPVLLALAPGLLPCLWFQAIRQYTVGMRRPLALLNITIGSILVNAALNWAFIQGTWVFPKLGLPGIGLSTTLVYLFSFLVFYAAVRRDPLLAPTFSLAAWRAKLPTLKRLVALGVPIAATYGSEAGFFSVIALLMGTFGRDALAAHTVVNQIVYIVFMVTVGLSHATSIIVSRRLAMGHLAEADRVSRTTLILGLAIMACVALLYLAAPQTVLRPFLDPTHSQAVLTLAKHLLIIAALLQCFDCWQNIGVGLLRALDDTTGSFRMALIGYWGVGLPAAWLIGKGIQLGPVGVWLGLTTGIVATAMLLLHRFRKGLTQREAYQVTM